MKKIFCCLSGLLIASSASAYSVKKGDTLSKIAEEHYGNWAKWKVLWKSNDTIVKNPNLIYPGQFLNFDESIPGNERLLLASNAPIAKTQGKMKTSQEWQLLPKQSWEKFNFQNAPEIDPEGFDRRSVVSRRMASKTTPTVTVASDRIAIEGEIISARTEYGQIFLGEQVFIRPEEQLQVGRIYSVSSSPQKIISKRDQRVGFAYDLSGKIKIIGVRDGLFIGTVIAIQKPIYRTHLLIPEVKPFVFPKAVASKEIIQASVLTTEALNSSMLGEQQLVILDVGSAEGVKPGMVFRNYLKKDPYTSDSITTKDYLIESEIQVLDVKDRFSTGIILMSRSIIHQDDLVLSLIDLKDFQNNKGMQTFIQDYDFSINLDDLDQMDDSQGLGTKEDQELRQLEKKELKDFENPMDLGSEPAPNDLGATPSPSETPEESKPATAPDTDLNSDLDVPPDEFPAPTPPPETPETN